MAAGKRTQWIEKRVNETRELARPVDFRDLVARGVLKKVGAWYRVLKIEEVPEHVWKKVREAAQDSKGIKIKIMKVTKKTEALARKVEGLT